MLYAVKPPSRAIETVYREDNSLWLCSEYSKTRFTPLNPDSIRVTVTREEKFSDFSRPGIVSIEPFCKWDYEESPEEISIYSGNIIAKICRATGSVIWYDKSGKYLLEEVEKDSITLEKFNKYKVKEAQTVKVSTADGEKEVICEAKRIPDGFSYHAMARYRFSEKEALYGLGQHEEGYGNLRGKTVYCHQANRKISVPLLISSLGWGLLTNTYSPFIFSDSGQSSYIYSEAVPELEYIFINGGDMRGTIRAYRGITGAAAILPKWAYGYIQSQERYETQDEIIGIAADYRSHGIGLDCVVLDWCSWEDGKWGQKSFDSSRFPDPSGMIKKLHSMHTHFMISVWANSDPGCENHIEFSDAGLFLPGQNIYNAFSEEGRKMYWRQLERGLLCHGVDAWWCDNSEPITPEWQKIERPEPSREYSEYVQTTFDHLPPELSNAFGFYHALGVYEGQRSKSEMKRVCNLTRSGYIGSQRLGTILWSGDISATWDTLSKQIAAGLGFCASGIPYWTTDIGAFFVKSGINWYWRGDYENTVSDLGYRELFTRWYQWGAFLPIFRGHGTDCRRELWLYENSDVGFYDAILKANRLRYEFMPYIYSTAGSCWLKGGSMIENLAFTWPNDPEALEITDQYMFGESIMVCPVHEPMYYLPNSVKIDRKKTRRVYLPKNPGGWYYLETDEHFSGGQWISVPALIDVIPLFVKAGSIIPMAEFALSTEEQETEITLKVWPGADGELELYEDDGDGYGYEKGEYRLTKIRYDNSSGKLSAVITHDYEGKKTKYILN